MTAGGGVDVLAANVEVRLWDSQWVNVVNHDYCYRDWDTNDAVAHAVRMTERLMAENITKGFPPAAYNRAAIAELIAADKAFDLSRAALIEVSNRITAGSRSDDDFRKQANAQHSYDRATARRASALAALEGSNGR